MRFSIVLLVLFLAAPVRAGEVIWPTAGWPAATPEEAGFDSAKLAEALETMRERKLDIHSLLVVRHGHLVLDATFYPYDGKTPHNLASVTKSVMTGLIGIAAGQGKLDVDQPALAFFPGRAIANRDARKERITVRQLAGMTSGLDCVGEHDEPTLHQMNASADWVQFTLDLKMAAEPGTMFSYCSPGMHLLSAILQKSTGSTARDYADVNLFQPLGIKDVMWPSDPQGFNHGWGDLFLFPQDAARIGYLWLHGGAWDGRQIVPKAWVEQSARVQTKTRAPWGDDYGLGWWIMSGDAIPQYAAIGRGGQRIAVFPTLDAVIVTTGGGFEPGDAMDLLATAFLSPGKPLPANRNAETALAKTLRTLSEPPNPTDVAALPPMASNVTGRVYRLKPNPLSIDTIRLDFDGSAEAKTVITFSGGEPDRRGAIGLDGLYRFSPGEDGLRAGIRGAWTNGDTFAMEYDAIAYIDAFDLSMHFAGDAVTIRAKDRTYEAGITMTGTAVAK